MLTSGEEAFAGGTTLFKFQNLNTICKKEPQTSENQRLRFYISVLSTISYILRRFHPLTI